MLFKLECAYCGHESFDIHHIYFTGQSMQYKATCIKCKRYQKVCALCDAET